MLATYTKQEATMQMERALATAAAAKQASWAGGQAASKPLSLAEIQARAAPGLIP
jgi:hypothetical protein